MIKENLVWGKDTGDQVNDCAFCGQRGVSTGWWMSVITPFMKKEETFTVYLCSDECKQEFIKHPLADQHILKCVAEISHKEESSKLNEYYAKLIDRHNKKYPENE